MTQHERKEASRERRKRAIRELWEKSGLSYQELSKITGIKLNTMSCYILGKRVPTEAGLIAIKAKVENYFAGGSEYINKQGNRAFFTDSLAEILKTKEQSEYFAEIVGLYDRLPTVTSQQIRNKFKSGEK